MDTAQPKFNPDATQSFFDTLSPQIIQNRTINHSEWDSVQERVIRALQMTDGNDYGSSIFDQTSEITKLIQTQIILPLRILGENPNVYDNMKKRLRDLAESGGGVLFDPGNIQARGRAQEVIEKKSTSQTVDDMRQNAALNAAHAIHNLIRPPQPNEQGRDVSKLRADAVGRLMEMTALEDLIRDASPRPESTSVTHPTDLAARKWAEEMRRAQKTPNEVVGNLLAGQAKTINYLSRGEAWKPEVRRTPARTMVLFSQDLPNDGWFGLETFRAALPYAVKAQSSDIDNDPLRTVYMVPYPGFDDEGIIQPSKSRIFLMNGMQLRDVQQLLEPLPPSPVAVASR